MGSFVFRVISALAVVDAVSETFELFDAVADMPAISDDKVGCAVVALFTGV